MIDYEAAISGKRPVKTRGGDKVRLISNQGSKNYPLVGYVDSPMGESGPYTWMLDGSYGINEERDLIQEPEVIEYERFTNVYSGNIVTYKTVEDAEFKRENTCLATIKVKVRIVNGKVTIHGESV